MAHPPDHYPQVRNTWMSVDAYRRVRVRRKDTYLPGFGMGDTVSGFAVGLVTVSKSPLFVERDAVLSSFGWREAFNAAAGEVIKIEATTLPPQLRLGVAGPTGFAAYAGLLDVARIKAGDVLFVSAAAGAVGSVVCQIAKIKCAFVIGSVSGPEECAFLRQIGVDVAIDHKTTGDLATAPNLEPENTRHVSFQSVPAPLWR